MKQAWMPLAIGLLLLAGLATACGGDKSSAPANAPSKTAAGEASNAEAIYKANCVSCHGADLSGKVGPNLQKTGAKLSQEQISAKIQNGGGGMPSYKNTLKEPEIQALTEWLSAKK
ncbi:c-type cytochrome [Paenibacillus ehimensis]|uniref:Cytochrome c n=1 Tax=Paenibacillus ehimensis TaxID=79264 RepID=A0ABT8V4L2_9BACL|nr:cytochrome c [Paenibacillus ehimensis]MDO3676373.1 cytochrome c [Paenibacillus ehimensis]MEC0212247.1 cytochrome c [Paenibacillus ehimensis]